MNKKLSLLALSCITLFSLVILIAINSSGIETTNAAGHQKKIYGWAWAATNEAANFGVGWIKFSNCDSPPNQTNCPGSAFGVVVDMTNGNLSGHAWSNNVGWVSFNRSETGNPPNPPGNDPGNGSGPIAKVNLTSGVFQGWGRVLAACGTVGSNPCISNGPGPAANTGGWDGWLHLADNSLHQSGPSFPPPYRGVTYDPLTRKIDGYAWGGVLGWIQFNKVVLGEETSAFFNYGLSNNGNVAVATGGTSPPVKIKKTYISGVTEPVVISIISLPPGITATIQDPTSCSPTCEVNIIFTAAPGTPAGGPHTISVNGISSGSHVQQATNFQLTVTGGGGGGTLSVNCSVDPGSLPPYYVNNTVRWQAEISGGQTPYHVVWTFLNPPGLPEPGESSGPSPVTIDKIYTKVGLKSVKAEVTDSSDPQLTGGCVETDQINVVVKPKIKEN